MTDHLLFFTEDILPLPWRHHAHGPVNIFNPALTSHPLGGYILAYRAVCADGLRRIGICKLDAGLVPIVGSSTPLSDLLRPDHVQSLPPQARCWFADPRWVWWQKRLYLYWNTGVHGPMNYQFIQEIDPHALLPSGPACTLERVEGRRVIEKNWSLFEYDGALHAFYTLNPLVVLKLADRTASAWRFSTLSTAAWDARAFIHRFGALRGGAPPLRLGDMLYVVFHARARRVLRFRYVAGLLITRALPPFEPIAATTRPLALGNPFGHRFVRPPLNDAVSEVVYPAGAALEGGSILVSYGINDEHAAVARLELESLEDLVTAVQICAQSREPVTEIREHLHDIIARSLLKRLIAYRRRRAKRTYPGSPGVEPTRSRSV
jgi:hypothetical protein